MYPVRQTQKKILLFIVGPQLDSLYYVRKAGGTLLHYIYVIQQLGQYLSKNQQNDTSPLMSKLCIKPHRCCFPILPAYMYREAQARIGMTLKIPFIPHHTEKCYMLFKGLWTFYTNEWYLSHIQFTQNQSIFCLLNN